MFLSKLEIFGFKSFATKTELTFNGGITSIVGPNGCGKTNILDAIRWVLGEQRTSMLRSDSMGNVIFNGSKARKPLGMAEVTMTIRNDKGLLPVDYSEVSITRRVFRSGGSEYFINKNQCRLKDIQDMLMDSGMAATGYSVIELKMVEDILHENADERRKMFEEASGVTKYKARRKAALSKLDDVQRDLLRVNDLISEIEKKVNSLERQAKRAEQYKRFTDELKVLEQQCLFAEYNLITAKIAPLKENLSVNESEKAGILDLLSQQEELLRLARSEIESLENSMTELRVQRSEKQNELYSVEEEIAVLLERVRGLNENIVLLEKRKVDLSAKSEQLSSQIEELNLSLSQAHNEEVSLSTSLTSEQESFKKFEEQLFVAREKSNLCHENLVKVLNDLALKQNDRERAQVRFERIESHKEELHARKTQMENEKSELVERSELSKKEKAKFVREIEEEKSKLNSLEKHREELFIEIEMMKSQASKLRDELRSKEARIDFLNGLIENLEGLPDGAKALARGEIEGLPKFEVLSDIFYVEPGYRVAAESVLGDASNFLVSTDEHSALSAIDALRKRDLGKVTFICLDKLRAQSDNLYNSSFGYHKLIDHIQTSKEHEAIGKYFFENVVVVDSFSEAEKVIRENPMVTCVNLSGDIFSGKGILRGGGIRRTEGGRVGKLRQLEELKVEKSELVAKLAELDEATNRLQSEMDKLPIRVGNETLRNLELQLARVEQSELENEHNLHSIETQLEDVRTRLSLLDSESAEAKKELEATEMALTVLNATKSLSEQEYQASLATLKEIEEEYKRKNERLREVQSQHIECVNKINFLKMEIESSEEQTNSNLDGIRRADEDIEVARKNIEESKLRLNALEMRKAEIQSEIATLGEQEEGLRSRIFEKKSLEENEERKLREARANHDMAVEAVHQISLKISELETQAKGIMERAQEEFNLELSKLSSESIGVSDSFDVAAARERVNYLKEKVESFGPVNLVAFSEYSEEKQRLDFLTAQREDLLEAEKTLTTAIDEINRTAHQKFLETFEQISENFRTTFQSLFDGGEAELKLEPNVDPLEAKIEIVAKPPGKRPQSIDLLSAGEKTLTAIALLFSIYLVKPSPFCILDEVDGPLDDNNTDNFVRMLKRFSTDTQFIVITHNKRTMEAADTLYGVTMEEQGVSKLVAVRFVDDWATSV